MKQISCYYFTLMLCMNAFLLNACTPKVDCSDLGCTFDHICDENSGKCILKGEDCTEKPSICQKTEFCNRTTHRCQSKSVSCIGSGRCSPGQVCNHETGLCETSKRCSEEGCPPAQRCERSLEQCIDIPCKNDNECPRSETPLICAGDVCREGCRPGIIECRIGEECHIEVLGNHTGVCREQCQQDQDCPFGSRCVEISPAGGETRCEAEPPCSSPGDCRPDEVCENSRCREPSCSNNNDCPQGNYCNTILRTCVESKCKDDRLSNSLSPPPNTSQAHSHEIPASEAEINGLILCPATEDWFSYQATNSELLTVQIVEQGNEGEIDVDIFNENNKLIGSDHSTNKRSIATATLTPGQKAYIRVSSPKYTEVSYNLNLEITSCSGDRFEPNNLRENATRLSESGGSSTTLSLSLCPNDTDWFLFPSLSEKQGLSLSLIGGPPKIKGILYAPNGETQEIARGNKLHIYSLQVPGPYYIAISSPDKEGGSYSILYRVSKEKACPNYNKFNTLTSSLPLSSLPSTKLAICPINTHWEKKWLHLETIGVKKLYTIEVMLSSFLDNVAVHLVEKNATSTEVIRSTTVKQKGNKGYGILAAQLEPGKGYYLEIAADGKTKMVVGEYVEVSVKIL